MVLVILLASFMSSMNQVQYITCSTTRSTEARRSSAVQSVRHERTKCSTGDKCSTTRSIEARRSSAVQSIKHDRTKCSSNDSSTSRSTEALTVFSNSVHREVTDGSTQSTIDCKGASWKLMYNRGKILKTRPCMHTLKECLISRSLLDQRWMPQRDFASLHQCYLR